MSKIPQLLFSKLVLLKECTSNYDDRHRLLRTSGVLREATESSGLLLVLGRVKMSKMSGKTQISTIRLHEQL